MRSSSTISLFSERPELNERPYSILVSVVAHGVVIGLISLGIMFAPKVKPPIVHNHYDLRHLNLDAFYPQIRQPQAKVSNPNSLPHPHAPGAKAAPTPPAMRQIEQVAHGPQTVIQPDILKPITLPDEMPLPTLLLWNAQKALVKLQAFQHENPPIANLRPSIKPPNDELKLADMAIKASNIPSPILPLLAGTTSPIIVHGPEPTPPAPVTTANGRAQSAAGTVLSLSELRLANGDVVLAPLNESASSDSSGELAAGRAKDGSQSGNGNTTGTGDGLGNGQGQGSQPTTTQIKLAKEGQFGSVIIGSSLEERYPETAVLWSGRMAYTVYLHVGLAKSWILQYSLSRDDEAASAGTVARIEAPWPYSIVRPNIAPGTIEADALMVHGYVNQAGRFEMLSIAFPPEFEQAQFVIDSLAQWQFRPATQNGKKVRVEVLLIIPDMPE
jgi:hypothetical protein